MPEFKGFPPGRVDWTRLPALFFRELLPLIDDLAELKVTLYVLWALQQVEGDYRYLQRADFLADEALRTGLRRLGEVERVLDDALAKAVRRGSLLMIDVRFETGPERLYFVNSERGRAAVDQIKMGNWTQGLERPVRILPQRPNAYKLYEDNIGTLTPMIAEKLRHAEEEYSTQWLVEAIETAISNNALSWRYIETVLESRKRGGGRPDETSQRHRRSNHGTDPDEWADFFER